MTWCQLNLMSSIWNLIKFKIKLNVLPDMRPPVVSCIEAGCIQAFPFRTWEPDVHCRTLWKADCLHQWCSAGSLLGRGLMTPLQHVCSRVSGVDGAVTLRTLAQVHSPWTAHEYLIVKLLVTTSHLETHCWPLACIHFHLLFWIYKALCKLKCSNNRLNPWKPSNCTLVSV